MNSFQRLAFNKRMLEKNVTVIEGSNSWTGKVIDVKDEETFLVKGEDFTKEVSIYDIRSSE